MMFLWIPMTHYTSNNHNDDLTECYSYEINRYMTYDYDYSGITINNIIIMPHQHHQHHHHHQQQQHASSYFLVYDLLVSFLSGHTVYCFSISKAGAAPIAKAAETLSFSSATSLKAAHCCFKGKMYGKSTWGCVKTYEMIQYLQE